MEAEELCRITVTTRPTQRPRKGFEKAVRRPVKDGSSARGEAAVDIVFMPIMRTAKLVMIPPTSRVRCFRAIISMNTPMMPMIGEKFAGRRSCRNRLSLWMPVVDRSQAVMVVPMLAPRITPTDCSSVMIWELTKPTTMTIVAPEDWMTAVTRVPRSAAFHLLEVRF